MANQVNIPKYETIRVVTVDILNFSERVQATFGPRLAYTDPQRLEALEPLKALRAGENDEQECIAGHG